MRDICGKSLGLKIAVADHFFARLGSQGRKRNHIDRLAKELDGPIGEKEIRTTRMTATETTASQKTGRVGFVRVIEINSVHGSGNTPRSHPMRQRGTPRLDLRSVLKFRVITLTHKQGIGRAVADIRHADAGGVCPQHA